MYTWIDNIIDGLNESCCTYDVYEILDIMGICIKKLEPTNILLQNNDSIYLRDYLNREIVFIRDDLTPELEKFILFHELGHALLHIEISRAAFNMKGINKDKLEKQANYFALKMINVELDEIELEGFSLEQICCCTGIPYQPLLQFLN